MKVNLFIALRYLFAKKSHNVINVISAISAAGIAIGTAALILILSVCNGFDSIIEANLSDTDAPLSVVSRDGSRFTSSPSLLEALEETMEGRGYVCGVLQENVFASYADAQSLAVAIGVDSTYEALSPLGKHSSSPDGVLILHDGGLPKCCVGSGLARSMGINPRFLEKLKLHFPSSKSTVPLAGAAGMISGTKLGVSSIISVSAAFDASSVVLPIRELRNLLGAEEGSVTRLELRKYDGSDFTNKERKAIEALLDGSLKTLDRKEANSSVYTMMKMEKFSIYLIIIFAVSIIAFNIFGTLSMLHVEKGEDIKMLSAFGATDRTIRSIFTLEGWMISLLGLCVGLVAGCTLAALQQHVGLVKMPGNFLLEAYPVILQWQDVLLSLLTIGLIGLLIATLSTRGLSQENSSGKR